MSAVQQATAGGAGQTAAGQPQGRGRRGRGGPPPRPLGDGPWLLDAGRQRIRVSVVTKGLVNPWSLAFLPDGSVLVTERPGRLRILRSGVLDPQPIAGLPAIYGRGLGGLLDVVLHPEFANNRLIYFSYSKPGERGTTTAVARARFDGGATLTGVQDVLVADAWHAGTRPQDDGSFGSRLVFDRDGLLFVTLGERNIADKAQDPGTHLGKILRVRDDGSVPPDNPFVGKAGYKPEIYSLGHRNPLGLALNPETGALWSTEQGPQGGDEVNVILPGRNYGWPRISYGRNYDGTRVGEGPVAPGLEDPLIFWVPAIAVSGLSFYEGERFPDWKGSALVGALRGGTGQHIERLVFSQAGLPTGREIMLSELKQRIRDVRPGPDGLLYVLTDEAEGAMLRIEPAP
jgi:glucose/arabinose dehydrogenase